MNSNISKQKCDLTNQLKISTEENKVLQNEIPQCTTNNLTNQSKFIKQITETY